MISTFLSLQHWKIFLVWAFFPFRQLTFPHNRQSWLETIEVAGNRGVLKREGGFFFPGKKEEIYSPKIALEKTPTASWFFLPKTRGKGVPGGRTTSSKNKKIGDNLFLFYGIILANRRTALAKIPWWGLTPTTPWRIPQFISLLLE